MAKIKASDVFTPGSFPTYTYVKREDEDIERRLRFALDTVGQVVSISGPSKSGKTVLVEQVVGKDNLIPITGAGINHPEQIWERILAWMSSPIDVSTSNSTSLSGTAQGSVKATANAIVAKGDVTTGGAGTLSAQKTRVEKLAYNPINQIVKNISNSDFTVLIDDFHYMNREVQVEAAKQIKEVVRLGVKIVTASVPHRSDDVVRANPELRGRVVAVDLAYWKHEELAKIGQLGFSKLNIVVGGTAITEFAQECAGSPQLMQTVCLNSCVNANIRFATNDLVKLKTDKTTRRKIYEMASNSTDFRSMIDVLESGPKTRGTERKIYSFVDGTEGDVYRCVLKAIAQEPLRFSFNYDEITKRVRQVCAGDSPVGSSVTGALTHMSRIAQENFPRERVIDYDEQKSVFDIPDPYLLFYIRWSGRLSED